MKRPGDHDERGAMSLAQVVITAPALLFLLMLIVQFGLMFHARNIAEQAAQEGAAVARRFDGTQVQGREKALQLLTAVGEGTLKNRDVTANRTADTATVTVTGTVVSVVPGFSLSVSESASGPVEKYVPPVDNP
ncbi:TadE family protein [Nocardioides sp. CF8]|uniref:TadE family protein n=1 Tax=Nocardioides sp. CF8 TaxID=110319 RepID=UPI00055E9F5D|nr:TadE family protein [Nocardioides sp. CF8]